MRSLVRNSAGRTIWPLLETRVVMWVRLHLTDHPSRTLERVGSIVKSPNRGLCDCGA
jgi:hypothetical protein